MISVTSKKSLNLDPIDGQIWIRGPRIYGFYYIKILQQILESLWEHLGKYYLWKSENQHFRKNRKFPKGKPTSFLNLFLYIFFEYIVEKYFLWR